MGDITLLLTLETLKHINMKHNVSSKPNTHPHADNMKPSRDINSKQSSITNKKKIDKNEKKKSQLTDLNVIYLFHSDPSLSL